MEAICLGDSNTYGRDPRSWLGVRFADAGAWDISLARDGVRFTEQGRRAFAAGLLEVLK